MAIDTKALGDGARPASQLCRAQRQNFSDALGEFAEQTGYDGTPRFANIHETAACPESAIIMESRIRPEAWNRPRPDAPAWHVRRLPLARSGGRGLRPA